MSSRTFRGYVRPDGRVGTRNYVAVVSTVNCSASTSKYISRRVTPDILGQFPNIDGVIPLTHKTGCGMAEEFPGEILELVAFTESAWQQKHKGFDW